ncbi:MAG: DNA-3-methyladenine glycosylase 2 family protein [Synergistaceae bacterium]|nr:DNA-3-methyladenine glycosylase 2 family protein [Synergistaceae bacterium]
MPRLEYGEPELAYLSKKDKKLGAIIERTGFIERKLNGDLFDALVGLIATQQISNKAAETVTRRMYEKFEVITPERLGYTAAEEIQAIGISMRKAHYIKGLCDAVLRGDLDIDALHALPDEEVAAKLLPIKGIGNWTVEMFLIFSLGRMDVVSWGDYAIKKGMMNLYGHKELDRASFDRYKKRYSPYGTVASLYLWEASRT